MAFKPPAFNLICNIWTGVGVACPQPTSVFSGAPRLTSVPCTLVFPSTPLMTTIAMGTGAFQWPYALAMLLLPKGTDIRGFQNAGGVNDAVECPVGSAQLWTVCTWCDRGKGYPNEHRVAVVIPDFGSWATPTP